MEENYVNTMLLYKKYHSLPEYLIFRLNFRKKIESFFPIVIYFLPDFLCFKTVCEIVETLIWQILTDN